jgi:P27 family predicted phage terminase small subunit
VLESFVTAVLAHRTARAALAKEALLIEPERTDTLAHVHPLTAEIRRQASIIRELGSCLGLTPQSRLQLLDGNQNEDMMTDFGPLVVIKGGRDG